MKWKRQLHTIQQPNNQKIFKHYGIGKNANWSVTKDHRGAITFRDFPNSYRAELIGFFDTVKRAKRVCEYIDANLKEKN